ncbi:hypothetical protein AMELA_G00204800 [Ameiurus melas]|uniref:Uncharacterized protein n=1 Tax=Ameiurus melas TaxID=219545 RepID=A0A7J6A334_AMEME|nr:hypothetical protein AMELA_G00204800 [Ameiurus melas]
MDEDHEDISRDYRERMKVQTKDESKGHGEPGAYPREHRAQDVHPGQGASLSQGTITHTYTHPFKHYEHFRISLPCMSLDWGRKPEYLEETPSAR